MNTNIENAIDTVREAFNFEVVKMPLSGSDNMYTPWYGLFRDDTCDYVGSGSVTERYVPHTSDDVVALVEAASNIFENEIELKCHFRDGHYVSVAPTNDYRKEVYGTSDNVFPRVMISAGLDGRAFQATMGYYRDLCQNLAMLSTVEGTHVSIRHTRSLRPKMDDLIATFGRLNDGWTNLTNVITEMESREVILSDFLTAIYGEPEEDSQRSETIHRNRTESIVRRVMRERWQSGRPEIQDFRVSAWEAFNAVQGYSQHDASRRGGVNSFDRVLLASRDLHVQKAEKLALSA
jgi:hypothetical protein